MRRSVALYVVAAVVLAPAAAEAKLRFRDCRGVECARLSVPLDRAGGTAGRVSLHVQRRPAARRPRRGVTLLLAGGPGQSATVAYEGSYRDFARLTPRNDIVAFDQRGTGRSGLLRCPALERANLVDAGAAAAACARRLGPRRGFYRTVDTVDDIEALRAGLGVEKLTLIGVSYGTLVAQAYAARYPARVERIVLDSVLGVAGWDPFYRDIFRAVPRVLRAVCGSDCRSFSSDPVADLGRLVASLAQAPLRGRVTLPDGRRRRSALTRQELFFTLVAGDLDDVSRAAFPAAVASALRGDAAPILRLTRRAVALESGGSPREFSSALYAATTCEEIPFPWQRFSTPATRFTAIWAAASQIPAAQLYPFDAATAAGNDFVRMCRRWPEASPAPYQPPPAGALPDVPVLMLSGEVDLRTPVEGAQAAAAGWPRAGLLVAPGTGHSALSADLSGCVERATERFFSGRRVPSSCRRRRNLFPATPPLPRALAELRPAAGASGARGRVLTAIELTLVDVAEESLAALFAGQDPAVTRGGGLRGGHWRWGRDLRLRHVELVPGVRLSGRIERFGGRKQHGRLRVSGGAGPNGAVALRGRRLRGVLGGKRVTGRILTGASASAASSGGLLDLRASAERRRLVRPRSR